MKQRLKCLIKIAFNILLLNLVIINPLFCETTHDETFIIENTTFLGDYILNGNTTVNIENIVFNVTGNIILNDYAVLNVTGSKLFSPNIILNSFSRVMFDNSSYNNNIKAKDFTEITINGSNFTQINKKQLIETSEAASIHIHNSSFMKAELLMSDASEAILNLTGPNLAVQTSKDSNNVNITNSMIPFLTVFGNSEVVVFNSTLGDVVVAQNGYFKADECFFAGNLGYYDYHAEVQIIDSFLTKLTDGIIYENQKISIKGDEIFKENYLRGVENINSTIVEEDYILYLLGELGEYMLSEISSNVSRILVESSKVEVSDTNIEDLVFFIGGYADLTIVRSNFDRIIARATTSLKIFNSSLNSIDFTNEIIDLLEIRDSKIQSDLSPTLFGGWTTEALIESSIIEAEEPFPDIYIDYINSIELRNVDTSILGSMCVYAKLFDSKITFSRVGIDRLYNRYNESEITLLEGAKYDLYLSKPATIDVKNIDISPKNIKVNQNFTVSFLVKNEGDLKGGKELWLFLDDAEMNSYEVNLSPGETKEYQYIFQLEKAGEHSIKVLNTTQNFIVKEKGIDIIYLPVLILGVVIVIIITIFYTKKS